MMSFSASASSVAAGAILLAISGTTADAYRPARDATQTLTFSTPFNGGVTRHVDLGKQGISAGDVFLVTGVPMNADGERIGTMDGLETIVSTAHDGTVSQQLTLRLARGMIMLEGVGRHTDTPFRLAVVGGTRDYAFARGQLTLLREDNTHGVVFFRLILRR